MVRQLDRSRLPTLVGLLALGGVTLFMAYRHRPAPAEMPLSTLTSPRGATSLEGSRGINLSPVPQPAPKPPAPSLEGCYRGISTSAPWADGKSRHSEFAVRFSFDAAHRRIEESWIEPGDDTTNNADWTERWSVSGNRATSPGAVNITVSGPAGHWNGFSYEICADGGCSKVVERMTGPDIYRFDKHFWDQHSSAVGRRFDCSMWPKVHAELRKHFTKHEEEADDSTPWMLRSAGGIGYGTRYASGSLRHTNETR